MEYIKGGATPQCACSVLNPGACCSWSLLLRFSKTCNSQHLTHSCACSNRIDTPKQKDILESFQHKVYIFVWKCLNVGALIWFRVSSTSWPWTIWKCCRLVQKHFVEWKIFGLWFQFHFYSYQNPCPVNGSRDATIDVMSCSKTTRAPSQYPKIRLFVRSR